MAAIAPVPLNVYLRSSYEPDAECVDGAIEERPMGERDHAAARAVGATVASPAFQRWESAQNKTRGVP